MNPTTISLAERQTESVSRSVTPEEAREILTENHYPKQRKLDLSHVRYLMDQMQRGKFGHAGLIFGVLDGKKYLLNGRHTLTASASSKLPVKVAITFIDCTSEKDLEDQYYCIDQHRRRNLRDMWQFDSNDATPGMGSSQITRMAAAVRVLLDGFYRAHLGFRSSPLFRDNALIKEAIEEWAPEGLAFFEAIRKGDPTVMTGLQRQTTMSVALVTLRYQTDIAEGFWRAIAQNNGLRKGEPTHTLHNHLARKVKYQKITEDTRAVANCWNVYYQNETRGEGEEPEQLSVIKIHKESEPRPILIAGTPYNGKQYLRHPVCIRESSMTSEMETVVSIDNVKHPPALVSQRP